MVITGAFRRLPILTLFLTLVPAALASHTWYVDGVNGSDNNNCQSPQQACKTISNAIFLTVPGDSIFVAPATYHESLFIPFNLVIIGSGAKTTIVDGGGVSQVAVVGSEPKVQVTLSQMTFQHGGGTADGGGVYNCFGTLTVIDSIITGNRIRSGNGADGYGAGIYNCPSSTLTLINTTISDNSALIGGGICNGGLLTIINTTFSGTIARKQRGGGIANYGTLIITNSTLSGNSSGSSGLAGGILNGGLFQLAGTLLINNSTLSGNTAGDGSGGGIFNVNDGSTVALQNSILANNTGGNCHGTLDSRGYNLSGDNSCSFDGNGALNNTDPILGPLQNNGGPTNTMALLSGSPAIDAGNPGGCTESQGNLLTTDQRGMPRPNKEDASGCDIGAYERQSD